MQVPTQVVWLRAEKQFWHTSQPRRVFDSLNAQLDDARDLLTLDTAIQVQVNVDTQLCAMRGDMKEWLSEQSLVNKMIFKIVL